MGNYITYSTEKTLVIRSWKLRVLKLFFQCLIFAYLAFVLYYQQGYQTQQEGFGFTQVSTLGNAYVQQKGQAIPIVWDAVDAVFPHKEHDALFVTTNYILTAHQERTTCLGTDAKTESCSPTANCSYLKPTLNGLETGNCIDGYCELHAWCPIEVDVNVNNLLQNAQDFVITVHNYANWIGWGYSRDTVDGGVATKDNTFTLSKMVEGTGFKFDEVASLGAAIGVIIEWNCNFDKRVDLCRPEYQFIRLDDAYSTQSTGFNFRFADVYRINDTAGTTGMDLLQRDLYKVYGIRLLFVTSANGKRFNLMSTILYIGSAIGMLWLANYISDIVCMWLLPMSSTYRNKKFMNVDEQNKESQRREWAGLLTPEQLNKAYF